jgi:hypothetical protein
MRSRLASTPGSWRNIMRHGHGGRARAIQEWLGGGRCDYMATVGSMSEAKRRFIEAKAPRVGDEAAEYSWRLRRVRLLRVPPIVCFLLSCLFRNTPAAAWTFFALGVASSIPLVVLTRRYYSGFTRSASKALGIKVTWKAETNPPGTSPEYEDWCHRHGIQPYTASKRSGLGAPS